MYENNRRMGFKARPMCGGGGGDGEMVAVFLKDRKGRSRLKLSFMSPQSLPLIKMFSILNSLSICVSLVQNTNILKYLWDCPDEATVEFVLEGIVLMLQTLFGWAGCSSFCFSLPASIPRHNPYRRIQ